MAQLWTSLTDKLEIDQQDLNVLEVAEPPTLPNRVAAIQEMHFCHTLPSAICIGVPTHHAAAELIPGPKTAKPSKSATWVSIEPLPPPFALMALSRRKGPANWSKGPANLSLSLKPQPVLSIRR